ncbi:MULTISPECIES: hypothetical protein [Bacillus cereus group]|uniref:hypothetical protein n=1 Tax=Bacillus cereus group TaxID=86661 RepID=UPI000BF087C4|nr:MULTISPECIES: hypothetical protein [Bacillus cereus group]PEO57532.1 hypothetical protein CN560_15485 [Bacillus wiedmannii]PGC68879.1 hypothetical protein COM25_30690 [Bacillus wiedmannii]
MIELEMTPTILDKHKSLIFNTNLSKKERIYKKIEFLVQSEKNTKYKEIFEKIFNELENIVLGNLATLQQYVDWFDNILKKDFNSTETNEIREKLSFFLDEYRYFSTKTNDWNAYEFVKEIDITICPYCNSQYIFVYNSRNIIKDSIKIHGKTRAVLDHFFDKGTYPFLAISIYNLVPCCKVCNSDFKGKKKMNLKEYYSPYEKGLSDLIKFERTLKTKEETSTTEQGDNIDYYASIIGLNSEFDLTVQPISKNPEIKKKLEGNLNLFHINDIYNIFHKKYITEIVFKAYIYHKVYKDQLNKTYEKIFIDEQELRKNLFEDSVTDKHKILGKLTRDILEAEINKLL